MPPDALRTYRLLSPLAQVTGISSGPRKAHPPNRASPARDRSGSRSNSIGSAASAISALDIAMWDIAGKYFDVPTYQLLGGGKTRDKARVYYHVFGDTKEKLIQGVKDAKAKGFTAVGHLTPFLDEDKALPFFPGDHLKVELEHLGSQRRMLRLVPTGPRYVSMVEQAVCLLVAPQGRVRPITPGDW